MLSWCDGTQAPGGSVLISCGICIVPEGTGTTVLQSPGTDSASGAWLYFEEWILAYDEAVTDVIAYQTAMAYRSTIDSKGMRIVRQDQEI